MAKAIGPTDSDMDRPGGGPSVADVRAPTAPLQIVVFADRVSVWRVVRVVVSVGPAVVGTRGLGEVS
jgi:hypothetical protein